MPTTGHVHHVALTVRDLQASAEWYKRVFDCMEVMREKEDGHEFIAFLLHGGTVLGLHVHGATPKADRFSETRVGLDHVSWSCANRAELDAWKQHLDGLGVENSGIKTASYGYLLVFRDPDNIQLELIAPLA